MSSEHHIMKYWSFLMAPPGGQTHLFSLGIRIWWRPQWIPCCELASYAQFYLPIQSKVSCIKVQREKRYSIKCISFNEPWIDTVFILWVSVIKNSFFFFCLSGLPIVKNVYKLYFLFYEIRDMWKLAPLSFAFEIWCGELSSSSAVVTLLANSGWTKIQQLSLWRRHAWLLFYFKTKENSSSDDRSTTSLR